MMRQHRLILIVLVAALAVFIVVLFSLKKPQSTLDNGSLSSPEVVLPKMEIELSTRSVKNNRANSSTNRGFRVSADTVIETSKSTSPLVGERTTNLERERLASLFKGESPLSVAKKLRETGEWNYAREYARMAVAENPDSFEALLLFAQLLPREDGERLAAFEQLVEIDSTSVEALHGLGQMLSDNQPQDAVFYLEAAIAENPSYVASHYVLGTSYERMGRYDEALASYKKAYAINQGLATLAHIRAIEAGNPRIKPLLSEARESKELPFKETPPQAPPQEDTPPIPNAPSGLERKTGFDKLPLEEPLSPKDGEATAADQRSIQELIQIIEEYEASLSSSSDPSAAVEGRITDLERSIESRPNRAESI